MAWNNFRSNYSKRFSQNSKNQQASNKLTRLRKRKTSSHDNSAFPHVFKLGLTFEPKLFKNLVLHEKLKLMSVEKGMHMIFITYSQFMLRNREKKEMIWQVKKKNVGLTKVNYFPKLFFCYKLYINDLKGL